MDMEQDIMQRALRHYQIKNKQKFEQDKLLNQINIKEVIEHFWLDYFNDQPLNK